MNGPSPDPAAPPDARSEPWDARLDRYSLTWVGAFDRNDLVGFVHACWDGGLHAFLLDTIVAPTHQHQGIGTAWCDCWSTTQPEPAATGCTSPMNPTWSRSIKQRVSSPPMPA